MKRFAAGVVVGVLLLPLGVAILGSMGVLPVAATAQPPWLEVSAARNALAASLQRDAVGLTPIPVSESALLAGLRIYRDNCAGCHGDFHQPSKWGSSGFYPRVPQFPERASTLATAEMFVAVKHGIRYSGMGAWESLLSDDDIWRVVTFVSHMHQLPPAVEAAWQTR